MGDTESSRKLEFFDRIIPSSIFNYPQILKSGVEFKIVGSVNNSNFLTVVNIPEWDGIVNQTYFATQSQVIFNNRIYQCVQAYNHDFSDPSTSFITPLDNNSNLKS